MSVLKIIALTSKVIRDNFFFLEQKLSDYGIETKFCVLTVSRIFRNFSIFVCVCLVDLCAAVHMWRSEDRGSSSLLLPHRFQEPH